MTQQSLSQKSPRPCLRQNGATTGVTIPESTAIYDYQDAVCRFERTRSKPSVLLLQAQQEQARLQVLNSLLAEHMTTEHGSDTDGSEHTPHQAHTGGIRRGRSSRTSSRQQRSQTCQRYTERIGERSSTSGAQPIRRSQPYAPERVAEGAGGHRHRS